MSSYVSLHALKSRGAMDITGSATDEELLRAAEAASRQADEYTGRTFRTELRTLYFDGCGQQVLIVPDLLAVTTLKTDDNRDGTYETTWAASDYRLLPANADPTTRGNARSQPFYKIEVNSEWGTKLYIPVGRNMVEAVGQWGYWRHLKTATETMDAIASTTATAVTASARTDVRAGMTILVDSEQMYVEEETSVAGLTVRRGVNGTTAATHSAAAAISIYEYPLDVVRATYDQTMHLFRRGMTGGAPIESGGVFAGYSRDFTQLLDPFRLWGF